MAMRWRAPEGYKGVQVAHAKGCRQPRGAVVEALSLSAALPAVFTSYEWYVDDRSGEWERAAYGAAMKVAPLLYALSRGLRLCPAAPARGFLDLPGGVTARIRGREFPVSERRE